MTPQEFENQVRDIVNIVKSGKRHEDSRVELKSKQRDARSLARQIAGHANAARGAEIIWIFGVDEDAHTVVEFEDVELSNWREQLEKCFDDRHMPRLIDFKVVGVDDERVTAALFDTSEGPYLVTNSAGGQPEREVPWRRGNDTRTAKRAELLQLLVPIERVPRADLLHIGMIFDSTSPNRQSHRWELFARLFIYPFGSGRLSVASHRFKAQLRQQLPQGFALDFDRVNFVPDGGLIRASTGVLLIEGPGQVDLTAHANRSCDTQPPEVEFRLTLPISEADFMPLTIAGRLRKTASGPRSCWERDELPKW